MAKHKSLYNADKEITAAQKLAEMACDRMAKAKKLVLLDKFWNKPEWSKVYLLQLRAANSLLKVFDEQAIFSAFNKNKNVWSLCPAFFRKLVETEQNVYDASIRDAQNAQPTTTDATKGPRSKWTRGTSLAEKLKGM